MGRLSGVEGFDFAFALSQRLGVPFYDKNILDLAAKNSHEWVMEIFESRAMGAWHLFGTSTVWWAFTIPTALFAHTEGILTNEKL